LEFGTWNLKLMSPEFLTLSILILLFSVIVHEVMHGFVALKFGDTTAQRAGRLTLNPLPHIDPFGTILLPALLIFSGSPFFLAWAKPVPVNPLNFTNLRSGELWVSAAGVLSNFALGIICALLSYVVESSNLFLYGLLQYGMHINFILGVFNLLPIPPLDGSKVLLSQLPYTAAKAYEKLENYGMFIIIALMLIPFGRSNLLVTVLGTVVSFIEGLFGF
jgi:Zn-dependent protease